MSDLPTPRTNVRIKWFTQRGSDVPLFGQTDEGHVPAEFAKLLERELEAMRKERDAALAREEQLRDSIQGENARLTRELEEANTQLVDAEENFIERLCEALLERGFDTSDWDGEDDPAHIIAAALHTLKLEWEQQLTESAANLQRCKDALAQALETIYLYCGREVQPGSLVDDWQKLIALPVSAALEQHVEERTRELREELEKAKTIHDKFCGQERDQLQQEVAKLKEEAKQFPWEIVGKVQRLKDDLAASRQREEEAKRSEQSWLVWSSGHYPEDTPGDVIAAWRDGTIMLDDSLTIWNPKRALEFIAKGGQLQDSDSCKEAASKALKGTTYGS